MLKSDLIQTDKQSIKILLRRKNLGFLSRTNHNTKPLCIISELLQNDKMETILYCNCDDDYRTCSYNFSYE